MSLTYCESCQAIEGGTKQIEIDGDEVTVCAQCESEDQLKNVPEHDEIDMER